jgi:hypothetical protein
VACVSEYDPTRLYPVGYKGRPQFNPMLSQQRCAMLLNKIASGAFLVAEAKAKAAKGSQAGAEQSGTSKNASQNNKGQTAEPQKPAAGQKITKIEKSVNKTVTETNGPPLPQEKPKG